MLKIFSYIVALLLPSVVCVGGSAVIAEVEKTAAAFMKNHNQVGSFVFSPANYLMCSAAVKELQVDDSVSAGNVVSFNELEVFSRVENLTSRNSLWVCDAVDLPISKMLAVKNVLDVYGCDFKNYKNSISDWLSDSANMLLKSAVCKKTKAMAVCASRYYSDWAYAFKYDADSREQFFVNADEYNMIPYMKKTGFFKFFENREYCSLKLQFSGKNQYFLVILPKDNGLLYVEQNFLEIFKKIEESEKATLVDVALPLIKIDSEINFCEFLENMINLPKMVSGDLRKFGRKNKKVKTELDSFVSIAAFETTEHRKITNEIMPVLLSGDEAEGAIKFIANVPFVFAVISDGAIIVVGRYKL